MLRPAALLVATLLLAGCVPSEPIITPAPEPSVTPIFASDEEALAAATEAYAKYLEVSDDVFQNGGLQTDALGEVLTGSFLDSSVDAFDLAAKKGLRSTGHTTFDQVVLQQFDRGSTGESAVVVYVCEDITGVDVVDSNGSSVVSPDRPDRTRFEVTFDLEVETDRLLISQRIPWSENEC